MAAEAFPDLQKEPQLAEWDFPVVGQDSPPILQPGSELKPGLPVQAGDQESGRGRDRIQETAARVMEPGLGEQRRRETD
tara:strand:+ start:9366 stop:9602 length:237 start_codon:yes stop_codon:yes gene_type:complete